MCSGVCILHLACFRNWHGEPGSRWLSQLDFKCSLILVTHRDYCSPSLVMCCFHQTHSKLMEVLILWCVPRDGQDIVCSFQNDPVLSSSISFRKMGIRIYNVCPVTRDSAVSCSAGGYCLHFVGAKAEREGGEGDSRELLMNTACRWWASAACFRGRHFIFWGGKMDWSQTEIVTRNSSRKREMGDFSAL